MNKMATRDGYGKALVSLGEKNKNIVVLDADLSSSTRTSMFAEKYPERFFNAGIAEQNLIGMAAGLASTGKVAFASTFAMFASGRCWEQIRNTVAANKLNVKVVASHGGITVGADGSSHQALEDVSIMRSIPEVKVVVPCDAIETEKIIKAAVDIEGPFYIRVSREKTPVVTSEDYEFVLGKGDVVADGTDVSIIACGIMVEKAMTAAKELKEKGVSARVVNMSSIKPIDANLIIESAKKTCAVVTAEEHSVIGGLGSAVCEVLSENCPVPVRRIGSQDKFGQSGESDVLLKEYNMETIDIVNAVLEVIKLKNV